MKKYGQAEFMMHVIRLFIDEKCSHLTKEQKEKILQESERIVFEKYPSSRELEFAV